VGWKDPLALGSGAVPVGCGGGGWKGVEVIPGEAAVKEVAIVREGEAGDGITEDVGAVE
jgi:hypothetical protein